MSNVIFPTMSVCVNTDDYKNKLIEAQKKRIEELESEVNRLSELVCKMCNGHGYVGNVMEDGDCPDCDGTGKEQLPDQNRIGDIQDDTMKTLSLSKVELAKACQVTRKTLDNWRQASTYNRRKPGMERLFLIHLAAKNWASAGFLPPGDSLKEPIIKHTSLYDLLLVDDIDVEKIAFAGSRLSLKKIGSRV